MARFLTRLVLLLCLWFTNCEAVWRYRTKSGSYSIFSTETTIFLEYEGTSFIRWDAPVFCAIDDPTATTTNMICSVTGTHRIKPEVSAPSPDDVERYLTIDTEVNCFMWYVYQDKFRLNNESQEIYVWIVDPENADDTEISYTARHPSLYSQVLSEQFAGVGQKPRVTTLYEGTEYSTAYYMDGEWVIEVPGETNDNLAILQGQITSFQDCFVIDTPFVIAQPIKSLGYGTDVSITLSADSPPLIDWAPCHSGSAVLVTDVGTFHTSNEFLTKEEIKFPAHIIAAADADKINAVAIAYPNIFILIKDILYQVNSKNIIKVGDHFPILDKSIAGVKTKTWCSGVYPLNRKLSEILIWTQNELIIGYEGDEFHPLADTGMLKKKLKLQRTVALIIAYVSYDSHTTTIAVLLECTGCLTNPVLYLAAYMEDKDEWILRDFILDLPASAGIHMEVVPSAKTCMVVWNNDIVFYTYKENKDYGYLQLAGTNTRFSAASEGSTIDQIIFDYKENVIIKLKNNDIFFFKFEMTDAVKLTRWVNDRTLFLFYFNPSDDIYLLTINGTDIDLQIYPLRLEVLDAATKLEEVCPYISYVHNINFKLHYIDLGESVTFWSQIVFLEDLGLSTVVEVYRPELLRKDTHINYEIASGICTKNTTITFYHKRDYSEMHDYRADIASSQGIMTVELTPSQTGKTCPSEIRFSHIHIGCPPGKKITVIGKPSECENFTFTIPWKYLRNQSQKKDLEIQYDVEKYGCPFQQYYSKEFRPEVVLHRQDKDPIPVETNYIVWEMNGRIDFSYSATMEQVQCIHLAQNWAMMIKIYNRSIQTIDDVDEVWGPHNYRSCFLTRQEELQKLNEPYEILNNSGFNFISWPKFHSGIYMFKLTILDPNFRPNWLLVAGWSTMILTVFLGVLVFSYFRYTKTFQSLPFVDPLLSLQPKIYAQEPDDGIKQE